ncbi:sensor histidine kinase [Paenibacillus psychroresistens]|uniref:histidine kinase n=1 Tax=Paenibacillus psychroresistens TaxID=1778678 RepID=A0A6B8RSU5_9BACL|nr:sensor histidine kinase [Paenibacillus psychroresistens]QGQ98989.1 sensor histidine kinase [Paenibacillus psychroresistens]
MKIWRIFQFKSIHTNIAFAFSIIILCTTLILSVTSYRLSADAVTENSLEYTAELIEQVNTNIQTYVGNMESISAQAIGHIALSMQNSDDIGQPSTNKQISEYFRSIVASRLDIVSIVYINSKGVVVSDRETPAFKPYNELISQEWFKEAKEAKGKVSLSSSHVQSIYKKDYKWVVSMSQLLPAGTKVKGEQADGVLLVDLNYNVITDLCKQIHLGKKGYIFILDSEGEIVYHPEQQNIYNHLKTEAITTIFNSADSTIKTGKTNENKIYTIRTASFGWKIVGVSYPDELVGKKQKMQTSAAAWGLFSLIIALGFSIIFSLTLTKPLKKLGAHMKQVETGDFDTRVTIESTNEIGKLSRTFNMMIGKIKDLMQQIMDEQEMKRVSELKALQAQIHPHFLYNTLDSIIWMAEMGKVEKVVEMTSALSKLLRTSISKGDELIPISVELDHIQSYLTIQKIRYRDKFTFTIDIDPDIIECLILRVVLQPLIENAIYHGMKARADKGFIQVTGRKVDGIIELKVMDDGPGMDPEKAHNLLLRSPSEGGKSMGLQNVNQRITLFFGKAYGLTFESELEEGTTVTIRIPILMQEVSEGE